MGETEMTFATMADFVGKEIGLSDWQEVSQEMINGFAAATLDDQWIHVDVERAKRESPFGGPVAHGYLTLSLIAGLSLKLGIVPKDTAAALNYGLEKVRFLAPVRAGQKVRLRVTLAGVEEKAPGQYLMKASNVVEVEGSDKPAVIAETLAMLMAPRPAKGA